MKRNVIFLLAFVALFVFACQNEQNANNTTAGETDTTASSTATDTGTTATDTTATSTTGTTTTMAVTSTAPLTGADADFAKKAAEGGMMEVDLGQLAAAKATSQDVKDFGNKMVTDHGAANDQLKSIASQKGFTLPTTPGAEEKKTANELEKKSGAAFDKAYMSDMVKDHTKDVAEFKKAASTVKDPDLKNWVNSTLTVIEGHLDLAKQVNGKLK